MSKKAAPKKQALVDPVRFNLASFADMLCQREPIIGEDPGSFEVFHQGLMASLRPKTPYECVIAENLVQIEWELLQQRRMREAVLRRKMRMAVEQAFYKKQFRDWSDLTDAPHETDFDEATWEDPGEFDEAQAWKEAASFAKRLTSRDPARQTRAYEQLDKLGMSATELMSEAYRDALDPDTQHPDAAERHDMKIRELERRRRDVKRDFDQLQQSRPAESVLIEQ